MLRAHPGLPFECTYHFIRVDPAVVILLDVIRGPRGNSLRFFMVRDGRLEHHEVIDESAHAAGTGSHLAPTGDRIRRRAGGLAFDVAFTVERSAHAVAPCNPLRLFDITAKDHPHVLYNGVVSYESDGGTVKRWTLQDAPGTISQHYGRALPQYLYFTTYPQAGKPQLVGAVSRVATALGFAITSSYSSLTQVYGPPRTRLSLRPRWILDDAGRGCVRTRHGDVTIDLGDERLAHDIDHEAGTTWFNARLSLPSMAPLAGLVETRGRQWMKRINREGPPDA